VERHNQGTARVIPIMVKPCDWQGTPFSKLQVLPKDAKPITKWDDRDEAFVDVVKGIRKVVENRDQMPDFNFDTSRGLSEKRGDGVKSSDKQHSVINQNLQNQFTNTFINLKFNNYCYF